jgi:hypothetical protein
VVLKVDLAVGLARNAKSYRESTALHWLRKRRAPIGGLIPQAEAPGWRHLEIALRKCWRSDDTKNHGQDFRSNDRPRVYHDAIA